MKQTPLFITVARVAAIVFLLVHIYNLVTKDPVPKWSYLLFTAAMFLSLFLNLCTYLKARKAKQQS